MRQPRGVSLKTFKLGKPAQDEGKLQNYVKGKYVRGTLLKSKRSKTKKNTNYPEIYGATD